MPVSSLGGSRLSIKSRLDRPADSWTVLDVDAARFINAKRSDRVNLAVGYLDKDTLQPRQVGWIKRGRVQEYRIEFTTDADGNTLDVTSLQGFDGITALLRQRIAQRFLHFPKKEVLASTPEAVTIPEVVGQFAARDVAAQILALVQGETFSLSWGCRDYQLLADFSAIGRPIDKIAELVEPWSLVEPFSVDIYIEGKTVIVQARKDNPEPDYTFDLKEARLDRLSIRKRQLPLFGTVTLYGRLKASTLVDDPDQPGSDLDGGAQFSVGLSPTEQTETTTSEINADPSDPQAKPKDFARIIVDSTYRMPDKILLRQRKRTYAGIPSLLVSDENIYNDWESSQYDESGPTNNPVNRGQKVIVEGYPNGDPRRQWRELRTETTQYNYDSLKFITSQITLKSLLNLRSGVIEPNEQVIKTYTDAGSLQAEEVTTVLRRRKRNTSSSIWYVAQRDTKPAGGYRMGGPGKGIFIANQALDPNDPNAPANDGRSQNIILSETIDTDPEAEFVEYRNENLSEADLEFIMDQFRRASGLWAYEVEFTCPIMAWIKRGALVMFENVVTSKGEAIPMRPALVIDVNLDNEEDTPSGTATITAMFWSET